ncbi:MAG TPA: HAD family phosphatase [Thermoanaerobaculia bacterium]|nr:HAD family phosphatase [Thermoanaerobaculia bacterium]
MTLPTRPLPRNLPDPIGAVIFDFDETMIDLEEQHALADAALCREMGDEYSEMPESFRFSSGRRIVDNIRELRAFFGWREDEETLFRRRHRLFEQALAEGKLELMPHVETVVRELHRGGLRLAITSSAVRAGIETVLRRFDLLESFELIVDGSEVRYGKPDPQAYVVTAARLDVDPATCVVFEDSGIGVASAKGAGMICIAVRNPTARQRQDLSEADLVLESFAELDVEGMIARATSQRTGR